MIGKTFSAAKMTKNKTSQAVEEILELSKDMHSSFGKDNEGDISLIHIFAACQKYKLMEEALEEIAKEKVSIHSTKPEGDKISVQYTKHEKTWDAFKAQEALDFDPLADE